MAPPEPWYCNTELQELVHFFATNIHQLEVNLNDTVREGGREGGREEGRKEGGGQAGRKAGRQDGRKAGRQAGRRIRICCRCCRVALITYSNTSVDDPVPL